MRKLIFFLLVTGIFLLLNASSCNEDDKDKPVSLKVTAKFTVTPESGTTNTQFLFNASSSELIGDYETVDYEWYFGDNQSIIDGNVTAQHSYASPGTYTVRLVIKIYKANQSGSAADESLGSVTVN